MKPKTTVHCNSEILRRATQPSSVLFKKKEVKRLSSQKKTVRFNLSTHLSTSELLLTESNIVDVLKPDQKKDQELTSKSSVSIADPGTAQKPLYKRPLACFFDQTGPWSQPIFRNITGLRKCFRSFADLYKWEPIMSLQKNLPIKGILKNTVCSEGFDNMCGSYPSHSNIVLARDSLYNVSETKMHNSHCLPSFSGVWDDRSMLDNLASSIQGLHISAFAPEYLGQRCVNMTSEQQGYTCPQIQPFPVYLPQNQFDEYRRGCVSLLGVDGENSMQQYDIGPVELSGSNHYCLQ